MDPPRPEDVITLNIGGKTGISALRRTLTQAKGSLLAAMFGGNWEQSIPRDQDGNVFIDQNPALFLALLDYLRSIQNETPLSPITYAPETNPALFAMIEYYGLTFFVYRIELRILTIPHPPRTDNRKYSPCMFINTEFWTTFDFHRVGHKRRIIKYTIVFGRYTFARIGWRDSKKAYPGWDKNLDGLLSENYVEHSNPEKGVGDVDGSVALNCSNELPFVYLNGNLGKRDKTLVDYPMERQGKGSLDFGFSEGSVLECWPEVPPNDNNLYPGRPVWRLDGAFLDSFATWTWKPNGDAIPCISIEGELNIREVHYDDFKSSDDISYFGINRSLSS